MKSIKELNPSKEVLLDLDYNYQEGLTEKLDNIESDFNQEIVNEIILWKVNRYAKLNKESLDLINKIDKNSININHALTGDILLHLLYTKGIRLPMASTILRFRNPNIYQIIDQRVYRLIYGEKLKLKTNVNDSIIQYLDYLKELREVSKRYDIPFSQSDRILYEYDRVNNLEIIDY